MRLASFIVSILGGIFGAFIAYEQYVQFGQHAQIGIWWVTVVWCALGVIAGGLILRGVRFAPWLMLIVTIGGVYPNFILWEGAGSFFLVSTLMGFTAYREKTAPTT